MNSHHQHEGPVNRRDRKARPWLERTDRELVALSRGVGALRLALGDGLAAMQNGGRFMELGFSSLGAYTLERLGRGKRWAEDTARVATKLAALPLTRDAVANGSVSWSMAELLARFATPDTEEALLAEARASTFRVMREKLATGGVGRDDEPENNDEPRRHLAVTVERIDAWALERTRDLVRAITGSGCDDTLVEALLAEAISTLQARRPDLKLPCELDDEAHTQAEAWREQLAEWRKGAERDCEERIPGRGGEHDYCDDRFLERLRDAIREAVAGTRPDTTPTQPERLDDHLRALGHELGRRDLQLGELALDFWEADGWRRLGYASAGQYVRERLGVSFSTLKARMTLARRCVRMPAVAATLDAGAIGLASAQLVARVAQPATVEAWLARAAERTTKHLREEVEAAESIARADGAWAPAPPDPDTMAEYIDLERAMVDGRVADLVVGGGQMSGSWAGDDPSDAEAGGVEHSSGAGGTPTLPVGVDGGQMSGKLRPGAGRVSLRFYLREDLAQLWHVVETLFQRSAEAGPFVAFLVRSFWHTWLAPDPNERPVAYQHIYERERHRCASPVCDNRDLTPHHLLFRSHGGGDDDDNLVGLCVACHLTLLHSYRLSAEPPANDVRWTVGRDALITVRGRHREHGGSSVESASPVC